MKKRTRPIARWEIGLSGGASSFVTSVNPEPGAPNGIINYWQRDLNPGIGLSVVRNLTPAVGIEINWLNTRLTGAWSDKYPPLPVSAGYETPLTFNSDINQFDLMMSFNVNQIMLHGDKEDLWHIYIKPGVGLAHIKDNRNFFPGDSPYTRLSVALDAGFSVSLNEKIKLMAGSTFRFVNTDNLDGVHVVSTDLNGETVSYIKVFEIYNYTYLRVSYCLGGIRLKKSKAMIRNNYGRSRICP